MKLQKHSSEITPELVRLGAFDENPGPFCMSFGFDMEPLARSIQEFGLINAPCVVQRPAGNLDIVTGYRRFMAVKALGSSMMPCRDLTPMGLSSLQYLLLNLEDNLATRSLNDVEKGMALARLVSHLPREEVVHRYMPLLNLSTHEPALDLYLEIERSEPDVKTAVAAGWLPVRTLKALFALDDDDRGSVFEWLSNIMLNSNQQRQFIELIQDISNIEGKSIRTILREEGPLRSFVQGITPTRPQKAKQVLELLRQRRFPRLFNAEKRFQKTVANMSLPRGVRIVHPPYFEAAQYRLEILFRDGRELRRQLEQLTRVRDLEKMGDPWEEEA